MEKIYKLKLSSDSLYSINRTTVFDRIFEETSKYKEYYEDTIKYKTDFLHSSLVEKWKEHISYCTDLKVDCVENETSLKKVSYTKNKLMIKPKKYEDVFDTVYKTAKVFLFFTKDVEVEVLSNRVHVTEFEYKWEEENVTYHSSSVTIEECDTYNKTIIKG